MSKLAKFLKRPRISRLITFSVVVVLIATSAYFAYKRGVFADTSTACTIKMAATLEFDNSTATARDSEGNVRVLQNGEDVIRLVRKTGSTPPYANAFHAFRTGRPDLEVTTPATYAFYGQGSRDTVSPTYKQNYSLDFDCSGGKIITITKANLKRPESGQGIEFTVTSPAPPAGSTTTHCIRNVRENWQATYTKTGVTYTKSSGDAQAEPSIDQGQIDGQGEALTYQVEPGPCPGTPGTTPPGGATPGGETAPPPSGSTCRAGEILANVGSSQECKPCGEVSSLVGDDANDDMYSPVNPSDFQYLCPSQYQAEHPTEPPASQAGRPPTQVSASGTCPSPKVKATQDDGSTVCVYCSDLRSEGGNYNPADQADADRICAQQQPGTGTQPGAGATTQVTWKCIQVPPSDRTEWFYKNTDQKWQHVSNSTVLDDATARSLEADSSASCGQRPINTPANAYGISSDPPASNAGDPLAADPAVADVHEGVAVPVTGLNQALLKTGKVAITAYRYSHAGTVEKAGGRYTPVGGVEFRISGKAVASDKTVALPTQSTDKAFDNGVACDTISANPWLSSIRNLFANVNSFQVITPDNGSNQSTTNLLRVPVGIYTVESASKTPGLRFRNRFCFTVNENQTTNLEVLLQATSGAEPPGISSGTISYHKSPKGVNRYVAGEYMYIPQYPFYGWQKINGDENNNYGYITGRPAGFNQEGGLVPNIDPSLGLPDGMTMAQLMEICRQSAFQGQNGQLGQGIDEDKLKMLFAAFGAIRGGQNGGDVWDILGGGAAGYLLGTVAAPLFSGNQGNDWSFNLNILSEQCRRLNQVAIPFDCQGCYYRGGHCPSGCPRNNAGYQSSNLVTQLLGGIFN